MKLKCMIMGLVFPLTLFAQTPLNKKILPIQHWQTLNGANVYFVRTTELPMVDIQVAFAAGSAYDGKNFGLANLVNDMMGQSTTTLNTNQIAAAFDNVGAQFSVNTTRDLATVSLRTLISPPLFHKALETFVDILSRPHFKDLIALRRTKNLVLAQIKEAQQTPTTIATDALYKALYANLPYGHSILGDSSQVNAYTPQQLQDFFQRYYVAKNAYIIVVGDLTSGQTKQIAKQIANSLATGESAPSLNMAVSVPIDKEIHIYYPASSVTTVIGQLGINRDNENFFPLMVGNALLGGEGLTSLLYQQVRIAHGLVYFIGSAFMPLRYRGPFFIMFQTKADQTQRALQVVESTLNNFLQLGPNNVGLEEIKQNLIGKFPLELASNKDIVTTITMLAFYHRPLNYLDLYRQRIASISANQIKQAFQKIVKSKNKVIITVGPCNDSCKKQINPN